MLALKICSALLAVPAVQLTVTSHGTGNNISFASSSVKGNPKILLFGFEGALGSNFDRSVILGHKIKGCKLKRFDNRRKVNSKSRKGANLKEQGVPYYS